MSVGEAERLEVMDRTTTRTRVAVPTITMAVVARRTPAPVATDTLLGMEEAEAAAAARTEQTARSQCLATGGG